MEYIYSYIWGEYSFRLGSLFSIAQNGDKENYLMKSLTSKRRNGLLTNIQINFLTIILILTLSFFPFLPLKGSSSQPQCLCSFHFIILSSSSGTELSPKGL